MANWTEEQLGAAWNKTQKAVGYDDEHRKDVVGAMIYRSKRNNTDMAWEVDHIFPKEILEYFNVPEDLINHLENLRAMHHSNNESKGISYPKYSFKKKWDEKRKENIDFDGEATVSSKRQRILRDLYEPILGMTLEEAVEEYLANH